LMSLCDSAMSVESSTEYAKMEEELDSLKLLATIKKLVYTRGHNKAMSHMNLMNLNQDNLQDIQECRDQCMAIWNMCDELGLTFGRSTDDSKVVLKEKGNDQTTSAQIKKATDKIEEEHHAIIFFYKADR